MRIIRPSRLALALLLGAAAPAPAQELDVPSTKVDLMGRSAARITWTSGTVFARGDTLRVRSVLINLSDTVIVADADPCDLRLGGKLALEPVGGAGSCRSTPVRVTPGDSTWTERAAVVASPPGRYAMELTNVAFTRRGQPLVGTSRSRFEATVVEPGARTGPARVPRQPEGPAAYPLLLRFQDDTGTGVTERDAMEVVQTALRQGGSGMALPLHPNAPAAASASGGISYLEVVAEREASGSSRLTIAWVDRRGGPCGSASHGTQSNYVQSPMVYGASLAMWVHVYAEQIRSQGCMSPPRRSAMAPGAARNREP